MFKATHQHVEHSCVPFALSLIHVLAIMLDCATARPRSKNGRTEPISYTELPNAIYISKYEKNTIVADQLLLSTLRSQ